MENVTHDENTLFKVRDALLRVVRAEFSQRPEREESQIITDMISEMLNEGILFRERVVEPDDLADVSMETTSVLKSPVTHMLSLYIGIRNEEEWMEVYNMFSDKMAELGNKYAHVSLTSVLSDDYLEEATPFEDVIADEGDVTELYPQKGIDQ